MSDFTNIIIFISQQVYNVFTMIDSVHILDSGFTVLDWFLAYIYLGLLIWFVKKLLNMDEEEDEDEPVTFNPPV